MATSESRRRIGVFCHCGQQNLGDEAIFAAVIQNVHSRLPSAEIIGFTINPTDSEMRHGLRCFPIRHLGKTKSSLASASLPASSESSQSSNWFFKLKRFCKSIPGVKYVVSGMRRSAGVAAAILKEPGFLFKSYRCLKGVELLLVAGSQQLNDVYGRVWGFPYTLLKWTLLSKCTGTKIAILSVGAGPINSPLSKFFCKQVLKRASYRSYRDAISAHLVASMGVKGRHPVFPDLVYSLRLPNPMPGPRPAGRIVVGANPVPFFDSRYWSEQNPVLYQKYVAKIARFAKWLDSRGHAILFFPTQARADVLTILDIRQAMNGAGNSENLLSCRPIHSLKDLVSEISRTDLVVANRYHGILISLALGKPVIGLAYHEKSRALLEQVGLGEYVLNSAEFEVEELIAKFGALEANAPTIRKQIAEHMAPLRRALDEQYDNVFALIGVAPAGMASAGRTN
jgi:polysaccharide pyruvyl transferase WcaK-like protein